MICQAEVQVYSNKQWTKWKQHSRNFILVQEDRKRQKAKDVPNILQKNWLKLLASPLVEKQMEEGAAVVHSLPAVQETWGSGWKLIGKSGSFLSWGRIKNRSWVKLCPKAQG